MRSMGKAQGSIPSIERGGKKNQFCILKFSVESHPAEQGQLLSEVPALSAWPRSVTVRVESEVDSRCLVVRLAGCCPSNLVGHERHGGEHLEESPEPPSQPVTNYFPRKPPHPYLALLAHSLPVDFYELPAAPGTPSKPPPCHSACFLPEGVCLSSSREGRQSGQTLRWMSRGNITRECPQTSKFWVCCCWNERLGCPGDRHPSGILSAGLENRVSIPHHSKLQVSTDRHLRKSTV